MQEIIEEAGFSEPRTATHPMLPFLAYCSAAQPQRGRTGNMTPQKKRVKENSGYSTG
jgi:hypothetical protein